MKRYQLTTKGVNACWETASGLRGGPRFRAAAAPQKRRPPRVSRLSRLRLRPDAVIAIALFAVLALTGCNRNTSSPQSGAAVTAAATPVAPLAAATPAGDVGEEDDIVLVGDADPDSGEVPLRVRFSVDAVLDEDLNQPTYTWDFGDGSPPSHERSPEHTYTKAGDYLATVRVRNKTGERGWDEIDIEAEAQALPAGEE